MKPDGRTVSEHSTKNAVTKSKGWLKNFLDIRPLLFRVVGRIVRPEEIEDIVQETFVLSYAASRKKKIDNPRGFMVRTAKNIALNITKRADKKAHYSFESLLDDDLEMHGGSVEDRYQAEEMFIYFCRAVSELPVDCRRVFILKKIYGLSLREIAERFGISTSMVEKHVAMGMAMTGRYMAARGYWDESELVSSAEECQTREVRKP
ncbi:MAG TPA: RNA polymerase sigma factor [Hyphomicrobiales bacterium]|nr:RNA polymerase sigma factor [Hyphomicrobiales bacterium]